MVSRRQLFLSLAALPLPIAAATAQPWWDERHEEAQWEREREHQRRLVEERHEAWDEQRAREAWFRQQRVMAQQQWQRAHGP